MSKAKSPQVSNADLRRQLDADVERFLKSGNKIQQIATGVSSQDYSKGRKHIVLGRAKQQPLPQQTEDNQAAAAEPAKAESQKAKLE
jgi:hypothetical protein